MTINTLIRVIGWTRNNLDVIGLVAFVWVICGFNLSALAAERQWPAPYLLGFALAAGLVGEAVAFAYWLSRD